MRITSKQAKFDVYMSWFIVNFVTGLIPIGLMVLLHNTQLPSSLLRDGISSYLAYMATLLLVSLYYDADPTGVYYRTRRVISELIAVSLGILFVLYNSVLWLHQVMNTYAVPVLLTIYAASAAAAFFLNRNLLNMSVNDRIAREPIDKADQSKVNVQNMRDQLQKDDL